MDNPENRGRDLDRQRQQQREDPTNPRCSRRLADLVEQIETGTVQVVYVARSDRLYREPSAAQVQVLEAGLTSNGMRIVVCDRPEP